MPDKSVKQSIISIVEFNHIESGLWFSIAAVLSIAAFRQRVRPAHTLLSVPLVVYRLLCSVYLT